MQRLVTLFSEGKCILTTRRERWRPSDVEQVARDERALVLSAKASTSSGAAFGSIDSNRVCQQCARCLIHNNMKLKTSLKLKRRPDQRHYSGTPALSCPGDASVLNWFLVSCYCELGVLHTQELYTFSMSLDVPGTRNLTKNTKKQIIF